MRAIVFDTETTGLAATGGDRLVEIGAIELVNSFPTGRSYHAYLNPERPIPPEAYEVHGLTDAFLADKPRFAEIVDEFLEFIGDARLVAHNAAFDIGFINAELARVGREPLPPTRVVDTLDIARRKFPGAPASLDALCDRFRIDRSGRVKHGALLDAELLAEVYIELTGGRQGALLLETEVEAIGATVTVRQVAARAEPLAARLTETDAAAHLAFVETLGEKALWWRYLPRQTGERAVSPAAGR
jgi:DNA polymerase-3 subunit epsilon